MEKRRVLIADADPDVAALISEVLTTVGCHCQTCCSGRESLDRLRHANFDLAVLDTALPDLDGLAVIRQSPSGGGHAVGFILLTTYVSPAHPFGPSLNGAFAYLSKPFELDDLVGLVAQYFASLSPRHA